LDGNHPDKKIIMGKKKPQTRENLLFEVAFGSSQRLCVFYSMVIGLFIGIKGTIEALGILEKS
jgi:hypothetical protein